LNIFLFWAICFYVFHIVDERIFCEGQENLKSKPYGRRKSFITKRMLVLVIIIVLLFFWSLQFFHGSHFILFWLVFLIIAFLIGLGADYRRKKNSTDE
jgi:di/tricarboxylate transporter